MVVNALCSFFRLPLVNWYPGNVPGPATPEIMVDGTGRSDEDILREAVGRTYLIKEDDEKFRLSPSGFEKLRGDYPLRREFPSFKVNLSNSSENVRSVLEKIGFRIEG
jgi:erythronate-4-phosphate dehydrogenase